MKRVLASALLAFFVTLARPSIAQDQADPASVQQAAEQFDAGSLAYREERFEVAASHFEAADIAVPSARAIRMAMRSRDKAGQGARAATLAALALERHSDDDKTSELARDVLERYRGVLHEVSVQCSSPCRLTVGKRAVPGTERDRWRIFIEPGKQTIGAAFAARKAAKSVTGTAGGSSKLALDASLAANAGEVTDDEPPKNDGDGATGDDAGVGDAGEGDEGPSWIESPAVFAVLLVATAGAGGVTIWSGVDTLEEPGADAVRDECRGQGTDCDLYQEGLAKQTRTNVMIGVTGGLGLLTGIFALAVTDWSGDADAALLPRLQIGPTGASVVGRF